jgi:hypothetical protein
VHGTGGPQPGGGLWVHGGPGATVAERLTGVQARGRSGERKLAGGGAKGRGDLRDPHRRQMGAVRRRWCPNVDEWRRRCVERIDARAGTVVWRRCSRTAFIGRGTIGGGRSRSNRRQLGGTSMAKPFRVGRKWGGGGGGSARGRWRRWRRQPVGLPEEEDGRAH